MNILAVIPARGGSKSIPRKNIKELAGKPLIAWTIEEAKKSTHLDELIVSTDDEEIAHVAEKWGANVPFMRPSELAMDDTPHIEPIMHALGNFQEAEWVLMLQPTSPLRSHIDIDGIIDFCMAEGGNCAVSVSIPSKHPMWMYRMDKSNKLKPLFDGPIVPRRQELPPIYSLNGALYFANTNWIRSTKSFLTEETLGYQMSKERSADIDDELDWKWAEFLLRNRNHSTA